METAGDRYKEKAERKNKEEDREGKEKDRQKEHELREDKFDRMDEEDVTVGRATERKMWRR
jgi:hypothetical protein